MVELKKVLIFPPVDEDYYQLVIDGKPGNVYPLSHLKSCYDVLCDMGFIKED